MSGIFQDHRGGAWTNATYLNGYGTLLTQVGYKKFGDSLVTLRGNAIKNSPVSGEVIFNLPAGFRPSVSDYGTINCNNGTIFIPAVFYITSTGDVSVTFSGSLSVIYLYFFGISFEVV